jgi:hypothetical protein
MYPEGIRFRLADGGGADGTSEPEIVRHIVEKTIQVGGTFVANVKLLGRAFADMSYEEVATFSAPTLQSLPGSYHDLCVEVTDYESGTVIVGIRGQNALHT